MKEEKLCPFFSFGQMVVLCIEVRNKRRKASPEEYKLSCGLYELEHLWGIWTEVIWQTIGFVDMELRGGVETQDLEGISVYIGGTEVEMNVS